MFQFALQPLAIGVSRSGEPTRATPMLPDVCNPKVVQVSVKASRPSELIETPTSERLKVAIVLARTESISCAKALSHLFRHPQNRR